MGVIEIAIPTDLALPLVAGLLVVALFWAIVKLRALPWDVSDGIAGGLARFAKVNSKDGDYAAAYAQLTEAIYTAWDSKDPVALLPLVANPIVIKAWNNLAPTIRKMGGIGGEAAETSEAYA